MSGTYLYAILAGSPHLHLAPIGLPDGTAEIETVSAANLTAVVSPYDGPPFERLPREALLTSLITHQRVVEGAMTAGTLLPVKLGTVLDSAEQVEDVLTRYADRLESELSQVDGAVEIDLSATWDVGAAVRAVTDEPSLAAEVGASAGEGTALRAQVERLVQERLARRRDEHRHRVVEVLAPLALDMTPHPLPSDDVVLNLAFLVARAELDRFEAAVDEIGDEHGDRLSFRYVGPLPPYSFALVQITRPDPAALEAARQLLGLGVKPSADEVREAYRRLAAERHPDRNPGDGKAAEEFSLLGAARDRLQEYISLQPAGGKSRKSGHSVDLRPEAVEGAALLEITRTDLDTERFGGVGA